jgi:hypothetical protein
MLPRPIRLRRSARPLGERGLKDTLSTEETTQEEAGTKTVEVGKEEAGKSEDDCKAEPESTDNEGFTSTDNDNEALVDDKQNVKKEKKKKKKKKSKTDP